MSRLLNLSSSLSVIAGVQELTLRSLFCFVFSQFFIWFDSGLYSIMETIICLCESLTEYCFDRDRSQRSQLIINNSQKSISKVLSQVCCFVVDLTIVSGKCFDFEVATIWINFIRIPGTHNLARRVLEMQSYWWLEKDIHWDLRVKFGVY